MEWFQKATNPWGQEVLVRISWDLLWLAIILAAGFIVFHLFLRPRLKQAELKPVAADPGTVPERIVRHSLVSRLFHWTMAASMLVLLGTGFLPVMGIEFSWVKPHWIAGVVLTLAILFHIVHATFFQSLRNIWISMGDIKEWLAQVKHTFSSESPAPPKPGKYPIENKAYHHAVLVTGMGVIITGALMMFRIDNPIVGRDPYMFGENTWGWIYVLHGLSAVGLVFLTIAHIYFAILPEKRWLTVSMFYGWIARSKYLEHHNPERWSDLEAAPEPTEDTPDAATAEA
jgi:cytochrome b subunit of formate dehydrogenase